MVVRRKKGEILFTAYLRQEGRIIVPKKLRDRYSVKEGDLLEVHIKKVK